MMLNFMRTSAMTASRVRPPARAISTRPPALGSNNQFGQRPSGSRSEKSSKYDRYETPINTQATPSGIATTLDDVGESSARAYAAGETGAKGLPLGERGHAPPQERSHMPGDGSMSQGHMHTKEKAFSGSANTNERARFDAAAMGSRTDQGVSGVPQYGRSEGFAGAMHESPERSGIGQRGDMGKRQGPTGTLDTHGMGGASQYNQGTGAPHRAGESSGFGEQRSTLESERSSGEISGMGKTGSSSQRATGQGGDASRSFGAATSGMGAGSAMNNYGKSDSGRLEETGTSKWTGQEGNRAGDMQSRNMSGAMMGDSSSRADTKRSGSPGEGSQRSSGDMRGQSDFGSSVRTPEMAERGGASMYSGTVDSGKLDKDFAKRDSNMGNTSELGKTKK
jgi:hypothetical protein